MLETGIDRLLNLVSRKGKVSAADAAKQLSVDIETIEAWAEILEKENLMSKEYSSAGALILSNTAKNTEEKKKKVDELRDDISIDVREIEKSIIEKENAIKEEHKKVADYEAILLREAGESEKLGVELKSLSFEEDKLKRAFKAIEDRERQILKESRSARKIINERARAAKKLEAELAKFESEKEKILSDVKVLEKISATIKNAPANTIYDRIEEVEKKAKSMKAANKKLGDKYSVIMRLLDRVK